MPAVCDQEEMSKSELTLPTEYSPVALESVIPSRKSPKRSKQSSLGLEKRRQELEIGSIRVLYELEEKKRQLEDDLKML
ncbi:hypothetical protein JTB14_034727 [Gonioctena quinquepunctata]|nr:hypothetical protein JTB14_034727 [Gonioctena quinquepunctata]